MSHAWVKKDNNQLQQSRRRLGFQMDAIMGGWGGAPDLSFVGVGVCRRRLEGDAASVVTW
jgi:hypothetical protein